MLHYSGNITAMQLAEEARKQIWMYEKGDVALVPFRDLVQRKKRFVKFTKMEGVKGWVYVDLVE